MRFFDLLKRLFGKSKSKSSKKLHNKSNNSNSNNFDNYEKINSNKISDEVQKDYFKEELVQNVDHKDQIINQDIVCSSKETVDNNVVLEDDCSYDLLNQLEQKEGPEIIDSSNKVCSNDDLFADIDIYQESNSNLVNDSFVSNEYSNNESLNECTGEGDLVVKMEDEKVIIDSVDVSNLTLGYLDLSKEIINKLKEYNVNNIYNLLSYSPKDVLDEFLSLNFDEAKDVRAALINLLNGRLTTRLYLYVKEQKRLNEVLSANENSDNLENETIDLNNKREILTSVTTPSDYELIVEDDKDKASDTAIMENTLTQNELSSILDNSETSDVVQVEEQEITDNDVEDTKNEIDNHDYSINVLDDSDNGDVVKVEEKEIADNYEDDDLFESVDSFEEVENTIGATYNYESSKIISKEYEDLATVQQKAIEKANRKNNEVVVEDEQIDYTDIDEINYKYKYVKLNLDNVDEILKTLQEKIDAGNLIGYDILQILSNKKIVDTIHRRAEIQLKSYLFRTSYSSFNDNSAILVSLILIAAESYDTNFWEHVLDKYSSLSSLASDSKIESSIRDIISFYSGNEKRHINFIIKQAIVPKNYLENSISFAFDIFDKVFEKKYIEDSEKIIAQVYLDLKVKDKEFSIADKTYKLIDTIKEIINNKTWLAELVAYTKLLLKYINAYYYEGESRDLPYKEYLEPVFLKWKNKNSILFKDIHRTSPVDIQYKPYFILEYNKVMLVVPDTYFNKSVSAYDVHVSILNNLRETKVVDVPDVRETMGVYKVKSFKILIENPTNKLSYRLISDNKVIYDSKDSLYRDYILFNDKNKEVVKDFNYQGQTNVVYPTGSKISNISEFYRGENYSIASKLIDKFDVISINGINIRFGNVNSGVVGEVISDTFIRAKNNKYPLYRKVTQLNIVTSYEKKDLVLKINNNNYHIDTNDFESVMGTYIYHINLEDLVDDGFYFIKVYTTSDDRIFKELVFIDKNYKAKYTKDDNLIRLDIESAYLNNKHYEVSVSDFNLDKLEFRHYSFEYKLYLEPKFNIPIYSINGVWHYAEDSLIYKELDEGTKIYIKGIDFDFIKYFNENKISSSLRKGTLGEKVYISLNEITSLKGRDSNYGYISFFKRSYEVAKINIYYRVILDINKTIISYNEVIKKGMAHVEYKGKDNLVLDVFHGDQLVYTKNIIKSPSDIEVDGLVPFEEYNIRITGGEEDLFGDSSTYELFNVSTRVYSTDDLSGHKFKLESGVIEKYFYSTGHFKEYTKTISGSYLLFGDMISKDNYEATLVVVSSKEEERLDVEVEILTAVQKGRFDCNITEDGDLILYNNGTRRLIINETENEKIFNPVVSYVAKFVE